MEVEGELQGRSSKASVKLERVCPSGLFHVSRSDQVLIPIGPVIRCDCPGKDVTPDILCEVGSGKCMSTSIMKAARPTFEMRSLEFIPRSDCLQKLHPFHETITLSALCR